MTTQLSFSELLERSKSEKIAVHTPTEEQAISLLNELDKKGFTWVSGEKLTDRALYKHYKEKTCYTFHDIYGKLLDKEIMYSPLDWYQDEGYTIIEFSDIDFKENK